MPIQRRQAPGPRGFFKTMVTQAGRNPDWYRDGCKDGLDKGQEMVLEVTIRPTFEHPLESSYQEILEALRKLGFSDG